ncbi:MAG: toll/interleukin-1 receptor domain-containing protein [Blastocatellia bacterium]|nr:toll/interleukin-1 receptor domain-containing protein [Blastocatellia bacterium]
MKIFISYSRNDSKSVYPIVEEMKKNDFNCWIDLENIEPSEEWKKKIDEELCTADLFLLFWSVNAKGSNYVNDECQIASKLYINQKIKILAVRLDSTKLQPPFDRVQLIDLQEGHSELQIKNFVNKIPKEYKAFSRQKPLKEQSWQEVEETPLVRVHYYSKSTFRADIIGFPQNKLSTAPSSLAVCLQFSQSKSKNMILDVYNTLGLSDPWILHITGPESNSRDKYELADDNPKEWEMCRQFVKQVIGEVAASGKTTLKFFTLAPAALVGGIAMAYYRFWDVQFFNWTGQKSPYTMVLDLKSNEG